MKLIVGLGNPGEKYGKTRHNLGFMIVEHFLKDFQKEQNTQWENSTKFKSDIVALEWKPKVGDVQKFILAKPKTYMNNSGMAVALISSFYKIQPSDIWVIHDDFDLPTGSMKIRFGGASAGHHGVESIIRTLNSDKFWRFRMGTGGQKSRPKAEKFKNAEDFVLSSFGKGQAGKIRELIKRGSKAIQMALEESLLKSQNRFNTR